MKAENTVLASFVVGARNYAEGVVDLTASGEIQSKVVYASGHPEGHGQVARLAVAHLQSVDDAATPLVVEDSVGRLLLGPADRDCQVDGFPWEEGASRTRRCDRAGEFLGDGA